MTELKQTPNGYSVKASQLIDVKKIKRSHDEPDTKEKLNNEVSETYDNLRKAHEKITMSMSELNQDSSSLTPSSLIIKNLHEYQVIQALRMKKHTTKIEQSKQVTSKLKHIF
jgi:hypothetical protein